MSLRHRRAWVAVTSLVPLAALWVVGSNRTLHGSLVHTRLLRSEPEAGDTVTVLQRVRLEFSEPVDPALSEVTLIDPSGRSIDLRLVQPPGRRSTLDAGVPHLEPGGYRVQWRTVSADGHPVHGNFVFFYGSAEGGDLPLPPPVAEVDRDRSAAADAFGAILRGLSLTGLLALAGTLVFVTRVIPGSQERARRWVLWLAMAVPVVVGAHLVYWLREVLSPADVSIDRVVRLLTRGSGALEAARVALTGLTLWGVGLARLTGAAAVFAVAAVVISGAIGHAATVEPLWSVPAKSVHLVAVSLWLGGLLALLALDREDPNFLGVARRVSGVALLAVAVILVTGIAQTVVMVRRPVDLFASAYGAFVLVKVLGLTILVALGARNRFVSLPRLAEDGGSSGLRSAVLWETAVMTVTILAAGWLARIPPPASEM